MILEFKDGSQLEVKAIFGGPKLVNGELRDTLRIEVDPKTIYFDNLKSMFKLNKNTDELYVYNNPSDVENNPINGKTKIGEGYNIFVSITDEERLISPPPGQLQPKRFEQVYIVTIAQMTYLEHEEDSSPVDGSNSAETPYPMGCDCDYITREEINEMYRNTTVDEGENI